LASLAFHEMTAEVSPDTAVTFCGALGADAGTPVGEALLAADSPTAFLAVTLTV
jgi:hypothetical protein